MKFRIFSLVLVLILCMLMGCISSVTDEGITSIQLVISVSHTFTRINIRETGTASWSFTRTGTFGAGQHLIEFSKPLKDDIRYDIQLVMNDNRTATKSNVLLSQNAIVTFDITDFDDETAFEVGTFHILNNTGVSFSHVYIGQTGSGSWSHSFTVSFSDENRTTITNITPPLNIHSRYDVQLRELGVGSITATKHNVSLTHGGVVVFNEGDF